MWSVLCVPYVVLGSNIVIIRSVRTGHVVSVVCSVCWVVGSNIVIGLYVLDMWSVCVFCMWVVGSNIVIGLYVLDMWSVLFVMYVGGSVQI